MRAKQKHTMGEKHREATQDKLTDMRENKD